MYILGYMLEKHFIYCKTGIPRAQGKMSAFSNSLMSVRNKGKPIKTSWPKHTS